MSESFSNSPEKNYHSRGLRYIFSFFAECTSSFASIQKDPALLFLFILLYSRTIFCFAATGVRSRRTTHPFLTALGAHFYKRLPLRHKNISYRCVMLHAHWMPMCDWWSVIAYFWDGLILLFSPWALIRISYLLEEYFCTTWALTKVRHFWKFSCYLHEILSPTLSVELRFYLFCELWIDKSLQLFI